MIQLKPDTAPSSPSWAELKELLQRFKSKDQSVTLTNTKKQLLIQQIENKLKTNGITLRTGKDATLEKMTMPQLKHFMSSLDKYLRKLGREVKC